MMPVIVHMIQKALKAVMEGGGGLCFRFPETEVGRLLKRAVQDQADIGWEQMVKERLSCFWRRAQEHHYATQHCNL